MKDGSEIISWLIEGAHNAAAPQALVEELWGRLIASRDQHALALVKMPTMPRMRCCGWSRA
jgi:hypothetical protein